jgi:aryl-alcohol dehydrogenase-like predicted oxidoreductase
MRHIDRAAPWDEILQAMEQLIREGKITYVGSSNFAGWDIATAQCTAASRNLLGLASEQSLYNLTQRISSLR